MADNQLENALLAARQNIASGNNGQGLTWGGTNIGDFFAKLLGGGQTQQPINQTQMQLPMGYSNQGKLPSDSMLGRTTQGAVKKVGPQGIEFYHPTEGLPTLTDTINKSFGGFTQPQTNPNVDTSQTDVAEMQTQTNPNANPQGNQQANQQTNQNDIPFGIKLMMAGRALQGGNPMDILQGLASAQQNMQQVTGMSPFQKASIGSGIYSTQIGGLKDLESSLGNEEERTNTLYKNILDARASYEKLLGLKQTKDLIETYKNASTNIKSQRNYVQGLLGSKSLNPPQIQQSLNNAKQVGENIKAGKTSTGINWKIKE